MKLTREEINLLSNMCDSCDSVSVPRIAKLAAIFPVIDAAAERGAQASDEIVNKYTSLNDNNERVVTDGASLNTELTALRAEEEDLDIDAEALKDFLRDCGVALKGRSIRVIANIYNKL